MAAATASLRRHVTVLFADLCGYTELNQEIDPEDAALILGCVREAVGAAVEARGGFINEWRGDGALCVFGLTDDTEEHGRHAVEAALQMHASIKALDRPLQLPAGFQFQLHSGLDSGLVFAVMGDPGSGRYQLVGDCVNTAARLCSEAKGDQVLVSEATLQGVEGFFHTRSARRLRLKGKHSSVKVYQILGRASVSTRFEASKRRGLLGFIGRQSALRSMKREFEQTLVAGGRVVCAVGSPGIGKTRLIEEFRTQLPSGVATYFGYCEAQVNSVPLQPFIRVARQVLSLSDTATHESAAIQIDKAIGTLGVELREHKSALLQLLSPRELQSEPGLPLERPLTEALCGMLHAIANSQPLVLVLDDWQWADDASRQALGRISTDLKSAKMMILLTAREGDDPLLASKVTIRLDPFDEQQSARVVESLLPHALDLGLARAIHERSGGNPLFLEELCLTLADAPLSGAEDLTESVVPTTLSGIVQARLERLPEDELRACQAAAVIGIEFGLELLQRLVPECHQAVMEKLVARDLVYGADERDRYRFKHGIMRDVVYDSIRLRTRKSLHATAATALLHGARAAGQEPPYETLSYHYAGCADHENAAAFAESAGDKAARACSLDRAREHYRAALKGLDNLEQTPSTKRRWVQVVSKWAGASLYNPAPEHVELLRTAGNYAQQLMDTGSAARSEYWLGWFYYALGEQKLAINYYEQALKKASSISDHRLTAQLRLNVAQSHAAACDYRRALKIFDQDLAKQRVSPRKGVPLGLAYAVGCKGLLSADQGEFVDAHACLDESLSLLAGSKDAVEGSCLGLVGMSQLFQGRWEDSIETASQARAMAERVNGPYVYAMSRTVSGYARWMLKRSPDALIDLERAVEWLEGRKIGLYLSFNLAHLAHALADADQLDPATRFARRALERVQHQDRLGEALAHRSLALISQKRGDFDMAEEHLGCALASAEQRDSKRELAVTQLHQAELSLRRGVAVQTEKLEQIRQAFAGMGMDWYERQVRALLE